MEADSSISTSGLEVLQKQIQDLTDVYNKLQALRHIPSSLLASTNNDTPFIGQTRPEFQRLREIRDSIRSPAVQEALYRAQDSLDADGTEINSNPRRESRKRRRPPSPASPQPYISKKPQEPRAFPPVGETLRVLLAEDLANYIREYNQEHWTKKLHIWRRNVVIIYISIDYQGPNGTVLIEHMTAFAPRERKAPHLQSEYTVFQALSQQLARVLHLHPEMGLPSLMTLLGAYERLFEAQCVGCARVLSVEGHVPPVVRLWREAGGDEGQWEPRHVTCRQDQ